MVGLSSDNANNVIYGFSVAASGKLTPLSGSPFLLSGACAMCNQPVSMAVNNNFILVGTSGFHGAGGVLVLPRTADGIRARRSLAALKNKVRWPCSGLAETRRLALTAASPPSTPTSSIPPANRRQPALFPGFHG